MKYTIILLLFSCAAWGQVKDTINITDNNELKQGHWIVLGENEPKSCHQPKGKVEEGNYK